MLFAHEAGVGAEAPAPREIWAAVERAVDRAPTTEDVRSHRLELFAARRWRSLGRPVPEDFVDLERRAGVGALAAPLVLEQVAAACPGERVVLLKGPEVAARYPDPALRVFGDLDVLVRDAESVQGALLAAGFEEIGDPSLYVDIHHLRPLRLRSLPLVVEVHSRPKWIESAPPPPAEELLAAAVRLPSGLYALPPAHHAVLLAAHSWAHEPLRRLRDLLDVLLLAEEAGRDETARLARSWGVERLWRATIGAADAVLLDGPTTWPLRLWAQNLRDARERTVLENHLQRWLSDFSVVPPWRAAAGWPSTLVRELRPEGDEGWGAKVSRSAHALRNARRRRSAHDEELAQSPSRRG
jgi:hypothetical protein